VQRHSWGLFRFHGFLPAVFIRHNTALVKVDDCFTASLFVQIFLISVIMLDVPHISSLVTIRVFQNCQEFDDFAIRVPNVSE
jgi:hypothetical protein